jgi:multimeric flavodoxin WrbA
MASSSTTDAPVQEEETPRAMKNVNEEDTGAKDTPSQRKENSMKVLALNSSPRGAGQSKTELMLDHLVQGMREAGANVELVDLRKKTIKNCVGCFTCWTKTPGLCIHKDDMTNELFPTFLESDLVIYATPLYHFTLNATMKAFIERTLPILQPFFEQAAGATHHPLRRESPRPYFYR